MLRWAKTDDGWAVNLDGSDAAEQFALPRLELRASAQGWSCVCMLPNGNRRAVAISPGASLLEAKRAALELARAALGDEYRTYE
jgi:hypothetical protein